jgi:hypothetical protein
MDAVKKMQKKKHALLDGASSKVKKGTKHTSAIVEPNRTGGVKYDSSQHDFLLDASNLKSHLQESAARIEELRRDLDQAHRLSKG